jgi:hypothetical protein
MNDRPYQEILRLYRRIQYWQISIVLSESCFALFVFKRC